MNEDVLLLALFAFMTWMGNTFIIYLFDFKLQGRPSAIKLPI